tara:strand:+ start:1491 stop:1931 length:441 start_codon:yes stop_codon:yes gene_type:complete
MLLGIILGLLEPKEIVPGRVCLVLEVREGIKDPDLGIIEVDLGIAGDGFTDEFVALDIIEAVRVVDGVEDSVLDRGLDIDEGVVLGLIDSFGVDDFDGAAGVAGFDGVAGACVDNILAMDLGRSFDADTSFWLLLPVESELVSERL